MSKIIKNVLIVFFFCISFLFSQEQPEGHVIGIDENGNIYDVSGATISVCGTNITINSDDYGDYTFGSVEAEIDFYILKATKDGFIPTYTIPTPSDIVEEELNTILMLPASGSFSPEIGKSHLIVVTVGINGNPIPGAEARVYDRNNNQISGYTIKYIKVVSADEEGNPQQIQLVDSPGDDTVGYIVYNLPPSIYFVSAYKEGITFNTRPAFTFANSVTTGITIIDGVLQAQGTINFTGRCVDIDNEEPVSGANITFIGLPNFSATTGSDGSFTIYNIPYPSIGVLKATKDGYKTTCYPFLISADNTEQEKIEIISTSTFNEVAENLGITIDTDRGNFVGGIFDYYDNSIRNIEIKGADETGTDSGLTVYYMDSNGENFDKNLTKTTDNSVFLTPNIEVNKPVYTKYLLGGNTIYYGFIFSFSDSIFINMFDFDIQKGNLELQNQGQESKVVDENASDVVVLKFNLSETTSYENVNLGPDTIVITDIGNGDITKISEAKLVLDTNNNGNYDVGELVVSGTINLAERKIEFHPGWTINAGSLINLLVLYSFNNATGGYEYKASIQKNSDIIAWGENSLLEVSVDGAPVEGGKITIQTQGAPDISVDPDTYNFGEIKVGEESDILTINVMNAGTVDLIIDGAINVSGDTADFVIVEDNVSNQTIASGGVKTINVKFKPLSNGEKQIIININSNDPDENPVEITLTGTGYGATVSGGGGGGGCFIATACFGNYNHPFVKILREFRDRVLLRNSIGRNFVKWYYTHSPKYAEIIKNNLILKLLTQILLIPVVFIAYLIVKGILPFLLLALTFKKLFFRKIEKNLTK